MFRRFIFLIAIAALAGGFLAMTNKSGKNKVVVEIADGTFSPAEVTIEMGGVVKFVNIGKKKSWPASDPHPTHYYYPATSAGSFDSQKPILPGKSWSFVFTEPGTWRYHDHLNPSYKGVIIVLGSGNKKLTEADKKCSDTDASKCFEELIRETLKKEGIEEAFAIFVDLFEKRQDLPSCHWTAHFIGEEVYKLFKDNKDFPISPATSYCGYGFYHGFMAKLLIDNPDPTLGLKFCEKVKIKIGDLGENNCIHGIGHGFTQEEPPDSEKIGNPNAMIAPALKVCEFLFGKTENKWEICATGAYSVVSLWSFENKYGLALDQNDPFAFCRTQTPRYQTACYEEFASKLDYLTNWNVSRLPTYLKGIEDEELRKRIVKRAAGVMMQRDFIKNDLSDYILGCRTLSGDLPLVCIGGISWGLVMAGIPGKEEEKALQFCQEKLLNVGERAICYKEVFSQLKKGLYWKEKLLAACQKIDADYREKLCADL